MLKWRRVLAGTENLEGCSCHYVKLKGGSKASSSGCFGADKSSSRTAPRNDTDGINPSPPLPQPSLLLLLLLASRLACLLSLHISQQRLHLRLGQLLQERGGRAGRQGGGEQLNFGGCEDI